MLILAIDTSGKHGSVALCECGAGALARDCRLLELVSLAGGTYSAQLMPQISALLARRNRDKRAIDAFAAASGPGSFTGLRVGLSTVKALAEVLGKPIAAVSLLEALATHGSEMRATRITTALDAARGQVFVGEYTIEAGNALPQLVREALLSLDEFAAHAKANPGVPVLTPDEEVAKALREHGVRLAVVARPQADLIARLGALKLAAGQVVSPEELDANYIRRADAEIRSSN